ncbi:hypothetical protein [Streptomyces glaucescens]|uniref:Uncharacterized protein n=1 Tax=Streptomyces glaucescens TaxID=1907 RepID=A0A089X418_STRGA|nr:hypothetical protein [Streptomyces glaucescens]AIR96586.1 hypothetical protein SGLAU_02790 [Streptomyces glaucescens]
MTARGFRPTHVVPRHGLPSWETPAPDRPTVPLDPLLPVQLVERRGDWGRIRCSNGWSAWTDGRRLVPVPQDPPTLGRRLAPDGDPRPLLTRAERALARYRAAVEELADDVLDGESFRERTRGLRIGVVVDGESVWLYDAERERWSYSDGTGLSTYAADGEPGSAEHPWEEPGTAEHPWEERRGRYRESEPAEPYRRDRGYATDPGHAPTRLVSPEDDL